MLIEQALLVACEDSPSRYRLIRRSPGLAAADARELAAWDPDHGSLLDSTGAHGGTHFFRLASGSFCLSRQASHASNQGSATTNQVQRLVIAEEALRSFGNNPFAVLKAATARGAWLTSGELPDLLDSVQLAQECEQPQAWLTWENLTMGNNEDAAEIRRDTPVEAAPCQATGYQATPYQATGSDVLAEMFRSKRDSVLALLDEPTSSASLDRLTTTLAAQSPAILELLERIDDLVFSSIKGDASALAELEVLWPLAQMDLDPELIEQSREQYLRCALSIWGECLEAGMTRAERAVSAIDVLCVLFEE